MESKLLYSTKEIFSSYLSGLKYSIPAYQRGYKWESKDILQLLDDISNFKANDDLDLFYCLQNITLVENEGKFNVVDGQQRLTTLAIILSYLGEYDLIRNKIEYKVRPQTEEFLNEFIYSNTRNLNDFRDWDDLIKQCNNEGKDYDFQDVFYVYNAYKTISEWFERHTDEKAEMHDKILNKVQLIVNLPKNIDEQELFENLNGKRVPLDGADLIRALIITRVAKKNVGEIDDVVKRNVLMNEQRIRIGLALDEINRWWEVKNRQEYFRFFVKEANVPENSNVEFDDEKYPINNLYKLYVLAKCKGELLMDVFEKESAYDTLLNDLLMLQRIIENWYDDKVLYHLILYSAMYCDSNKKSNKEKSKFKSTFDCWNRTSRNEFIRLLKTNIAGINCIEELLKNSQLSEEDNEKNAFNENWYDDDRIITVAVLLDIINILGKTHVDFKLPARYFKRMNEDKEHIFPQTPIGDRIKDKEKQTNILKKYIEIINKYNPDANLEIVETDINWDDEEWKERTKTMINDAIGKVMPINSIGNLCLLCDSVNRGYGNDFFLEKRIDIMQKVHQGYYIRPHVYDAFNKSFLQRQKDSIDMKMMEEWNADDVLNRRAYVIKTITEFLTK